MSSRLLVTLPLWVAIFACARGKDYEPNRGDGGGGTSSTAGAGGAGGAGGEGAGGGVGSQEPLPGDLVLTELMVNPQIASDTYAEWIEVLNTSDKSIDLEGLVLRHEASGPTAAHVIGAAVVVSPGQYVVLGKDTDTSRNGGVTLDYVYPADIGLTNDGDYVAIERDDGTIIDHTFWSEAAPTGASRSLDPGYLEAALNDDSTNFCAASTALPSGDLGTPGLPNDACP